MSVTQQAVQHGPAVVPPDAIVLPGSQVFTKWVHVTPEVATDWLTRNLPENRRRMPALVDRYDGEMRDGGWANTHLGIAFDARGHLVDGQHRLAAVVQSGLSQWFLVTWNLPRAAVHAIDRGKARTVAHTMQMLGYQWADADAVAVGRVMMTAPNELAGSNKVTDHSLRAYLDAHQPAIMKARGLFPKHVGPALFRGCVAKATYHVSGEAISRFVLAVTDDVPAGEQTDADRFVRKAMPTLKESASSNAMRAVAYRKFQRLLASHVNGEAVSKLYECTDDLFPIPAPAERQAA